MTLRQGAVFDTTVERESAAVRATRLDAGIKATVARAYAHAPAVRARMDSAGVGPSAVQSVADLRKIPVLRKDDLASVQAQALPFGGLNALAVEKLQRLFMSPGNIYDPQGEGGDFWRFAPALAAAGFRAGDIVQNTFSYHMTPAGFMFDGALRTLGCVVVPAGVGQTELQVRMAADLKVSGYTGTPSFLHTLLTKAREIGPPLAIEVAFVTGEMLPPALRAELENDFAVRVLQGYGTADLGCLAYECSEKNGMHLHGHAVVEILDIETREPVAPGQPGEIVATIFDEAYPLIRFATGDLSTFLAQHDCPCGRTAPKLAGIMGRIGDAVKVKGMFVRGSQIDEVMKRFIEVGRYQAIVTRENHQDRIAYEVELNCSAPDQGGLAERLAQALREQVKVRGDVTFVAAGVIAENAKRIDDRRTWR
jgi:phenylacetate-CoA ligase